MFSIVPRKLQYENMSHFDQSPEFAHELKKLVKKYPSLPQDLKNLEDILVCLPTGRGNNFTIVHSSPSIKIVKTRLACKSLRDRSIRIMYAYHEGTVTFMYLEIYFKGDKESEDRERIKQFLKNF